MNLTEYLIDYGYNEEDAREAANAYHVVAKDKALENAVKTFEWADDDEHDYTGELRNNIKKWETEEAKPKRVGFWWDPEKNLVEVGYFKSESNFHYLKTDAHSITWSRSASTNLEPLEFEEGFRKMMEHINKQWHNREEEIEELRKIQKELKIKPSAFNRIKL